MKDDDASTTLQLRLAGPDCRCVDPNAPSSHLPSGVLQPCILRLQSRPRPLAGRLHTAEQAAHGPKKLIWGRSPYTATGSADVLPVTLVVA